MERLTFTDDEMKAIDENFDCPVKNNPDDDNDLVSRFCEKVCDEFQNDCPFEKTAKKLKTYEDLEEQGLLHIAPLKDGTPIYAIVEDCVDFGEKERYIVRSSYLHGVTEYDFGELNKDFFTSEQAAENYLSLRSSGVIADLEKLCEKTMKTNV